MKKLSILSLLGLLLLSNLYSQDDSKQTIKEINNLLYVEPSAVENDSLQRLNLVIPTGIKNYPLLIWIGGGAWSYVDRHVEMDVARKFGQEQVAVAAIGHRLSSAVWKDPSLTEGIQHPKHIEDVAAAIKFLYDHAPQYGYDREKIFIGGFSSGAHLAALICLDDRYLKKVGLSPSIIKGLIPISGAYDIVNYYEAFLSGSRPHLAKEHVQAVFGETQQDLIHASPTNYLDNLSTPMLVICDNGLHAYTRLFEERIRETEFREMQVIYSYNLSHAALWKSMSHNKHSLYRELILSFIRKQLDAF